MGQKAEEPVLFYEPRFYMFSNFAAFAIVWKNQHWMTAEHAYQATKFTDPSIQTLIHEAPSAHEAKWIAKKFKNSVRSDWESMKLSVMEDICRTKLAQHDYIEKMLLETGTRTIIEDSPTDAFWGWGPNKTGHNYLGKIWMDLRDELLENRKH